jgi:hypothetical protein
MLHSFPVFTKVIAPVVTFLSHFCIICIYCWTYYGLVCAWTSCCATNNQLIFSKVSRDVPARHHNNRTNTGVNKNKRTKARTAKPEVKTRFSNTTTRRRISYLRCLMYLTSSTGEDYRVITFVALYDLFSCFDIVVFCSFYVFHLLPFSSTICIYSCEFAIFRLVTGTWVAEWWK